MESKVLMPLWVFLVWGETPAWWTVAGAGLILVGLLLRYVVWELLAAGKPAGAAVAGGVVGSVSEVA